MNNTLTLNLGDTYYRIEDQTPMEVVRQEKTYKGYFLCNFDGCYASIKYIQPTQEAFDKVFAPDYATACIRRAEQLREEALSFDNDESVIQKQARAYNTTLKDYITAVIDHVRTCHDGLIADSDDVDADIRSMWWSDHRDQIHVLRMIEDNDIVKAYDYVGRMDTAPRETIIETLYTLAPESYNKFLVPHGWHDYRQ